MQKDPGFDKNTFDKQLSVMYGQIYNLLDALRNRKTPAQLVTVFLPFLFLDYEEIVQMPSIYMVEIKKKKRKQRGVDKLQEATGTTNLRFIDDNVSDLTNNNNGAEAGTSGTGRGKLKPHLSIHDAGVLGETTLAGTSISQSQLTPLPEIGGQHAWHTIFKQKIQVFYNFFAIISYKIQLLKTRLPFFSMW